MDIDADSRIVVRKGSLNELHLFVSLVLYSIR